MKIVDEFDFTSNEDIIHMRGKHAHRGIAFPRHIEAFVKISFNNLETVLGFPKFFQFKSKFGVVFDLFEFFLFDIVVNGACDINDYSLLGGFVNDCNIRASNV